MHEYLNENLVRLHREELITAAQRSRLCAIARDKQPQRRARQRPDPD